MLIKLLVLLVLLAAGAYAQTPVVGGEVGATAASISFTPAGTIAATDVQAAIEEVAAEGGGVSTDDIDTSAEIKAIVTDETGSGGALVFATSPTLTTPALGTPSALVLTNATGLPVTQAVGPVTCTDAGANDTYTCTMSPVPSAASDVKFLWFDPNTDNTGAATLDIGPGSALSIYKAIDGVELIDGDLLADEPVLLRYCAACNSAAGAWLLDGVRGVPRSTAVNLAVTSTADAVVQADGTGKIDSTWFPVQTASVCFSVLEDPAVGDELAQWIPFAATVVRVQAGTTTGTVTLNVEKRTTVAGAGTDVLSADLVADATDQSSCASGCDVDTISSGSVSASSWLVLTVSAVSTPGKLTACPVLEF